MINSKLIIGRQDPLLRPRSSRRSSGSWADNHDHLPPFRAISAEVDHGGLIRTLSMIMECGKGSCSDLQFCRNDHENGWLSGQTCSRSLIMVLTCENTLLAIIDHSQGAILDHSRPFIPI